MTVLNIETQDELEKIINDNQTVVVDFAAPAWCVPCQRLEPHFEAASERSDATFVTVDIDKAPWVMVEYGVQSVPTVMVFRDGKYEKHIAQKPEDRKTVKLLSALE